MNYRFKAGNLVFETSMTEGVRLTTLKQEHAKLLKGKFTNYYEDGRRSRSDLIPSLFLATQNYRQALVTIWGEENVPELPLQGTPLAIEKLKLQKYGMCWVSDRSDKDARERKYMLIVGYDSYSNRFITPNGGAWNHAVLVDNNGDEIIGG